MAEECDSKRLQYVSLYRIKDLSGSTKKRKGGLKLFHFFFFALYIYQAYWVTSTIGGE